MAQQNSLQQLMQMQQQGNQGVPQGYNPQLAFDPYQAQGQPKKKLNWGQKFWNGAGEFFKGRPASLDRLPTGTANQTAAREYATQSGLQNLQNPYQGFDENVGQYATNKFNQQIVPGLAEQFTSLGGYGSGALTSPGFAQQLGGAGAQLAQGLGSMRHQYGQQNIDNGLRQLEFGDRSQFQYNQNPGSNGLFGGLAEGAKQLAPIAAQAGLMYATGGLSGAPAIASGIASLASSYGYTPPQRSKYADMYAPQS
jgi:hypothetical protein